LIELLCQGEKSVEALAREADRNVKNASAHLKDLRAARLVRAPKKGKYVRHRLADEGFARFWVILRRMAEGLYSAKT
jgi:DNA-binding transcriptional ArsR family regulator